MPDSRGMVPAFKLLINHLSEYGRFEKSILEDVKRITYH